MIVRCVSQQLGKAALGQEGITWIQVKPSGINIPAVHTVNIPGIVAIHKLSPQTMCEWERRRWKTEIHE